METHLILNILKRKWHNLTTDKKFSEILTGSVWALSSRFLATGFGLVFNIFIARFYGAEVMGIVAVLNSFLMLATILTVMGTDTSILRLIPEHLAKYSPTSAFKLYRKTQYMVIGVSLVIGTLFFFGADLIAEKIFSKPQLSFYFALAAVFFVFKSLMLLNTQAVRGLKLIRVFALMQIFPQGFTLVLFILLSLFLKNRDVPVYAQLGGFALTGIIGWIIVEYAFSKKKRPDDTVQSISARTILSISLPMLMTVTTTFIIGQTGVIMLGMFGSEAEIGYYAIAIKLATLTSFMLQAINSISAPSFSELFYKGKIDELFHVAKKSAKLIFWTTSPILVVLLFFGKLILSIVFGKEFGVAYPALVFLVFGQFVNSISGSTGIFMNMTGNQNVFRNIIFAAALINIVLNLLLIPDFGINGAAIAAMASLCFWNITTLLYIKVKFGKTTGYVPLMGMS